MIDPFIILASGAFTAEQVLVTYVPTPRLTTPDLEQSIAEIWEDQTARAKIDGRMLFNGEMLRYLHHEVRDTVNPNSKIKNPKFEMHVGPTCYRDFVGTNLYSRHCVDEIGWQKFSNPVGTTGTILTSDGQICYGRRSPRVAWHANHVHTFGGALEMADRSAEGTIDVFASLRRELHEELGLNSADIESIVCTGLIRDREIHQPELLFDVTIRLTAGELEHRWQTAESRDEHIALVFLPDRPEAIEPFIRSCDLIAPVAIGALHLHARRAVGRNSSLAKEDLNIVAGHAPEQLPVIKTLFREYADALGFHLSFQDFEAEMAELPGRYAPPEGAILMAKVGEQPAGCVAMKKLGEGICEMKRFYVRDTYRGTGIGRRLAEAIISEARVAGYQRMRLDTVPSMQRAIAIYESLGFRDTDPYVFNPVPGVRYLELVL